MKVDPGGYAWWYIDAMSADDQFGITLIAFVGSVFSPYYRRAGRQNPLDHCALNVALYGPRGARWAMTEHGKPHVERRPDELIIGRSSLHWQGSRLVIDIDEVATPFPRRVKGRVTVETEGLGTTAFAIDDQGKHRWRPLSPLSTVRVEMQEPSLSWTGHGYLDSNDGDELLEDGFAFWDWSRTIIDGKSTAILYNTDMTNGSSCLSAFLAGKNGEIEEIDSPPPQKLPSTPIWRIRRRTRAEGEEPRIVKTLEDTPFYSRSVIETTLFGKRRPAIHESLSGPRLRSPIVQFMLPYRMPRKP